MIKPKSATSPKPTIRLKSGTSPKSAIKTKPGIRTKPKSQPEPEPKSQPEPKDGVDGALLCLQQGQSAGDISYVHAFRHPTYPPHPIEDPTSNGQEGLLVVLLHPTSCQRQNLKKIGKCLQGLVGTWGEIPTVPDLCAESTPTALVVITKVLRYIRALSLRVNEQEDVLAIVVHGFWAIASYYPAVRTAALTIGFTEEATEADPAKIVYQLAQKLGRSIQFRFVYQGRSAYICRTDTVKDIRQRLSGIP